MQKHLFFLALAALILLGCSLTSGATGAAIHAAQNATGTPTASATPETNPTHTPTPQRCTVTTGTPAGLLNLRACPGTDCDVIEVLEEGDRLQLLQLGDWYQVQTEAGAVGFVNSNYCQEVTK